MTMIDARDIAPSPEELAAEETESKSRVPKDESPENKFTRISAYRLDKIIDDLRKLGNLAGGNYKSSQKQRDDIIKSIRYELERLELKYGGEKNI